MSKSQPRASADTAIADFLRAAGWADAALTPLAGDASSRSYQRAKRGKDVAILMIAPPGAEQAACPPDASPAERETLGYNAKARLAGPNLSAFVAIASALRKADLSAPQVFAADEDKGLALIEDLGDDLFTRVAGALDEETLYANAVDTLIHLRRCGTPPPASSAYEMLEYDPVALAAEMDLLIDWYWPLKRGSSAPSSTIIAYADAVAAHIKDLSSPTVLVLRDFHAENLLWMPERKGVKRVGVIDFQDGLIGSPAYDLVSLLEDARRDVSADLADAMIARYCDISKDDAGFSKEQFLVDYAILAPQRNAKILGIFARLANRDGKKRYLDFIPRVENLFRRDLERPQAAALKTFFEKYMPELVS
jgi:aminoglycoside/choline kinase family phosphotransferase